MGSHLNFKNGDGKSGNSPLVRQSSVYSLTFDEFQSTWGGGIGKDLGSMNMDELLKNIWTAEETQAMTNSVVAGVGSVSGGNLQLQRQGSLTLPRTLSQKTVDEVWRDLVKESSGGAKDGSDIGSNLPQRQQTLGEMTLEEFLARAGVVREDATQLIGRVNNGGFFDELSRLNNNNSSLALGFQPQPANNLALGGIRSSQQLPQNQNNQHRQPLFPKPANMTFAPPMQIVNSGAGVMNNGTVRGGGMSVVGLGTGGVSVATGSPANQISPDLISKNNSDTPPSLSPVPNMFGRGRKTSAALEKVIERRHRRMIKNRESAQRSRARKQAYTLELEVEVAKLKEMNQELQRKQAEIMEMQKNQFIETMKRQWGSKRQCLRRTLTGPW